MNGFIDRSEWAAFLHVYGERNRDRPTRIGIFEKVDGAATDYWIEDGLPLVGLDAYPDRGKETIDIVFENYTHTIADASELVCIDKPGAGEGLDISDAEGRTTQLRFEDWVISKEQNGWQIY